MTEIKGRKKDEGNEGVGEMVGRDRAAYGERSQRASGTAHPPP